MKKLDLETVRGEISHHISPVIGWLRLDAANGKSDTDGKRHEAWLERLDKAAEAIVELATDAPLEYYVIERRSDSPGYREMTSFRRTLEAARDSAKMYSAAVKWSNEMNAKIGGPVYSYQVVSRPKPEDFTVLEVY
jgi:hypothetical protein